MQHLSSIDPVAEGDVLERDIAANWRQRGARRVERGLRRGVEDVAEARNRQPRLMEVLPDLRQAQHRRAHSPGQHVESNQLAHAQIAVDDELRPEDFAAMWQARGRCDCAIGYRVNRHSPRSGQESLRLRSARRIIRCR